MNKNIIVLGAGRVGGAMAIDLNTQHNVTVADISTTALAKMEAHGMKTIQGDLSDTDFIQKIVVPFDLVIGAVPGFMGYVTLEAIIKAGKDCVDISFFPEDPFSLEELAKKHDVTIVMDCGVAPGMGNIILGYHNQQMKVLEYRCLVGGLPREREWPYEYKAVFSPIDVIEEYIRPARYVVNGKEIIKEALSDTELHQFKGVGTLESWNSDGLRSLIKTMPHIPDMIEKTLRYPGCVEYLKVLRESGFFSYEPIEVNGVKIRPIDMTAKLLFPKWQLKESEEDFTIMQIDIIGENKSFSYSLLDRYDKATDTISMARTTGYTATAVANLVLNGMYQYKGISPPEYIGKKAEDFEFVLNYLAERGVVYEKTES